MQPFATSIVALFRTLRQSPKGHTAVDQRFIAIKTQDGSFSQDPFSSIADQTSRRRSGFLDTEP